jgi:hypothetical protein
MTIASEIQRIKDNVAAAYAECSAKGATLPTTENSANLPDTISSITGGGGGGTTVTAVNKTESAISVNDKVWVNNGSIIAGTSIDVFSDNYSADSSAVINGVGNTVWGKHIYYSLSGDKLTRIGDTVAMYVYSLIYRGDYIYSMSSSASDRVDGSYLSFLGAMIINSDYDFGTVSDGQFVKRNYETNEVLKTYTNAASSSQNIVSTNEYVVFDGVIYRLHGSAKYKYTIDEEASTYTRSSYTYDAVDSYSIYPLGVIPELNYVVCSTQSYSFNTAGYLRLVEYIKSGHLKALTVDEMPADLQPYFSTKKGTITFNPNTGVLAIVTSPTDYIVMQYTNGAWHKLSIDLGFPEDATTDRQAAGVSFTNDMSRCAIGYSTSSSNYTSKIVNLANVTGYVAVSYKPYNITAETVTGYAKGAASVDGSFEASVASRG